MIRRNRGVCPTHVNALQECRRATAPGQFIEAALLHEWYITSIIPLALYHQGLTMVTGLSGRR
jgi:hypothetical protein